MPKRIACAATILAVILLKIAAAQSQKNVWQKLDVPTSASFRGLSAVAANIVWASGTNGTIIRTTDGGTTWSIHTVAGAEKLDFRGIHAFDASTAVIMSSGNAKDGQARIYGTTDGGENWKLVYEQKTRGIFFDAIAFWDRNHGIVVSDPVDGRFALFTTEDSGATWKPISPENIPAALPNEGAFAASNSCLTVEGTSNVWFVTGGANVARVFRSTDRGKSWQVSETPMHPGNASSGLFSIAFRDAKNGIAVGGDYAHPSDSPAPVIFLTSDGGATWNAGPATNPPGLFFSAVAYRPVLSGAKSNDAGVAAAGTSGINSLHANGKWTRESEQNTNAIAFAAHNTGWAVGPKCTVLRTKK
jgi:photosystem II stability/assembly factor-like uncharacterized protein